MVQGFAARQRQSLMQELHRQLGDGAAIVADPQPTISAETAQVTHLDLPKIGQRLQPLKIGRRNGQHHSLLRLR